jgi:hypothetical protein
MEGSIEWDYNVFKFCLLPVCERSSIVGVLSKKHVFKKVKIQPEHIAQLISFFFFIFNNISETQPGAPII